jgi:hypothetical protein
MRITSLSIRNLFLVASVAAASGSSLAQDAAFCNTLTRLQAEARSDSANAPTLPNAECKLKRDQTSNWKLTKVRCTWEVENPRTGLEQFNSLSRAVAACFPSAKVEETSSANPKSVSVTTKNDPKVGGESIEVAYWREHLNVDLTVVYAAKRN